MSHRLPVALCGFSAVGLLAFALVTRGEESNAVPIASKNPAIDPARDPFAAIMLKAAEEYVTWGRYNNQLRWAPALCAAPSPTSQIISPEFSDSGDKTTHGGKLYSLFVKDRLSYLKVTMDKSVPQNTTAGGTSSSDNRTGQIIVKESWTTKPIENLQVDAQGMPPSIAEGTAGDRYSPYAKHVGHWFQTDKKSALFIMVRLDPATPATDDGWVYATVSPDGQQVTSVGQVKSCMDCHQHAPHGRLFGPQH